VTTDLYAALFVFSVIMAFTPGPNNTIMMASGVAHGFLQTFPAAMGVAFGFPFQALCIGLELGKIFEIYPETLVVLKYAGAAYMVWLAWKIASDTPSEKKSTEADKPLNFFQTFLFQWVNPKAWIMAITALTSYTLPGYYWIGLASVVGTFIFTGVTSATTWAAFGAAIKSWLTDPKWYRAINASMALLLLVSLVPMLRH
jgi:threonine/homoserine/homoserine lactone efflux protein